MAYRKILVKGHPSGNPMLKEGAAGGAITPGHLIQWSSGSLIVHGTEDGHAQKMVALENYYTDTNDSSTVAIDDAYASGETVPYVVPARGTELYMILADGETITKGEPLASKGDGTLKSADTVDASTLANAIVGYAAEDVTTSGATARIVVEIA